MGQRDTYMIINSQITTNIIKDQKQVKSTKPEKYPVSKAYILIIPCTLITSKHFEAYNMISGVFLAPYIIYYLHNTVLSL